MYLSWATGRFGFHSRLSNWCRLLPFISKIRIQSEHFARLVIFFNALPRRPILQRDSWGSTYSVPVRAPRSVRQPVNLRVQFSQIVCTSAVLAWLAGWPAGWLAGKERRSKGFGLTDWGLDRQLQSHSQGMQSSFGPRKETRNRVRWIDSGYEFDKQTIKFRVRRACNVPKAGDTWNERSN